MEYNLPVRGCGSVISLLTLLPLILYNIFFRMRCTLYGFITDYVKDIFIEDILFHILEKLKEVTEGKTHCTKGKKRKRKKTAEQSLKVRNATVMKEVAFAFCDQGSILGAGTTWVEVFCFS